MAGSEHDDDESVLDPSEQVNRPPDVALYQQRIQAWHPVLDPVWVICALFYLGLIFVPTGIKIRSLEQNVVEMKFTYDDFQNPNLEDCRIGETYNANRTCNITFTAPEDMKPPILVYYELTNFHQNHRNYFQSRDDFQLLGQVGNQDALSKEKCEPVNKLGDVTINPCGLIANTFFNDYYTLVGGQDTNGTALKMEEDGIAWTTDIEWLYKQPDGFDVSKCPACNSSCCEGEDSSCDEYKYYTDPDGVCYSYFYPLDNETQYLYETYPDIISPLEGVLNEHFIVWMRVATQPNFRKLYGWINQPIAKGSEVVFRVNANYVVSRFRGTKSLIMTTNNIFGGKNPYFGRSFWWVGIFCLAAALFFSIKHFSCPRKLADEQYLQYKEE